jgi:mRNA interferase MazF
MRETLPTMPYSRGDVLLVDFVSVQGYGASRRPAVVLSSDAYNQGRQDAIVAAITSNVSRLLVGDHPISAWRQAGLLYPSVVTGIIRTIKQHMIARRLGALPSDDMAGVGRQVCAYLGLD